MWNLSPDTDKVDKQILIVLWVIERPPKSFKHIKDDSLVLALAETFGRYLRERARTLRHLLSHFAVVWLFDAIVERERRERETIEMKNHRELKTNLATTLKLVSIEAARKKMSFVLHVCFRFCILYVLSSTPNLLPLMKELWTFSRILNFSIQETMGKEKKLLLELAIKKRNSREWSELHIK